MFFFLSSSFYLCYHVMLNFVFINEQLTNAVTVYQIFNSNLWYRPVRMFYNSTLHTDK